MERKRIRRSNRPASAKVTAQRLKTMLAEGFHLFPGGPQNNSMAAVRTAFRTVSEDDVFWRQLENLIAQKEKVAAIVKEIEAAGRG